MLGTLRWMQHQTDLMFTAWHAMQASRQGQDSTALQSSKFYMTFLEIKYAASFQDKDKDTLVVSSLVPGESDIQVFPLQLTS